MYIPYFDIYSLPPMVDRRCPQVYAACSSVYIILFILSSYQSFAYCLESSTNAVVFLLVYFFGWDYLS